MSVFISKEIPSLRGTCFWFALWMYVDKQVVVIVAFITNFGFCAKVRWNFMWNTRREMKTKIDRDDNRFISKASYNWIKEKNHRKFFGMLLSISESMLLYYDGHWLQILRLVNNQVVFLSRCYYLISNFKSRCSLVICETLPKLQQT